MAKTELAVFISREGTVTIEVEGARGASCLDLTRDMEESLGFLLEREKKPAFYGSGEKAFVAAAGRRGGGR